MFQNLKLPSLYKRIEPKIWMLHKKNVLLHTGVPNMTEINRINKRLARDGRVAYNNAKSTGKAFIAIGNSIYRMSADGVKHKVGELSTTRVKVKQKSFVIK